MPSRRRSAHLADVSVPVDAALKKRWDELSSTLHAAQAKGASAFDDVWEAAAAIVEHEPPLYVLGGYATAREFFREVLHEDERLARRMMRVARFATPAEEQRYGTSKLDAALAYLEAKTGGALVGSLPVAFERLKLPITRDGKRSNVPLEEVTVAEIQAATRGLAASKKRERSSPARHALVSAVTAIESLAEVRVSEANGYATFAHVPLAALGVFRTALGRVKLPGEATATRKRAARG